MVTGGAYHLSSDLPVVVYQFNALQYQKDDALSYSNDASLLLPSTAMTGNYRVMGMKATASFGSFAAITATQDNTTVNVALGSKANVVGGGAIDAASANGTLSFTLNAGDVAEILTPTGSGNDLSGSLVQASAPVQVITGATGATIPEAVRFADHIEEALFPAETLGAHYVIARPLGPRNNVVPQLVRLYGNIDGTTLTYKPSKPSGCPDSLEAGQVVDCGETTDADFEVTGSHEFGAGIFTLGSELVDPDPDPLLGPSGDPDESVAVTVEQFRTRYVFLAPEDYEVNYVVIVAPAGTTLTLDGDDKSSDLESIDGTDYFVARIELGSGDNGGHELEASNPVGIQVFGYGAQTSYQYPGGLNLGKIAAAPPH